MSGISGVGGGGWSPVEPEATGAPATGTEGTPVSDAATVSRASATAAGSVLDLGVSTYAGERVGIHPTGYPVLGGRAQQGPPGLHGEGAQRIYRAGKALVEAPRGVLSALPAEVQRKLFTTASAWYDRGLARVQDSVLRDDDANRVRSGAAATLLALYEGAADPEFKQEIAGALLDRALEEPLEGLRANVFVNLEAYADELSPENAKKFDRLRELVLPSHPPYDEWFKDGNDTLNVVHYAHDDCWKYGTDPVTGYKQLGLKVTEQGQTERGESYWIFEGTVRGENGGEQKTRVKLVRSHEEFVRDMDDPDVEAIFYTGHSNLGGNISEALRRGPEENGKKLLQFGLCRGQQNIFEVANKYPNAQLSTSHDPSYFVNMTPLVQGALRGIADRESYEGINAQTHMKSWVGEDVSNYIRPNELRRYEFTDLDLDGEPELGLDARDRFYDVLTRSPSLDRTDLVPRAEDRPAEEIPATSVMHGVNFARTLLTYHVEKSHEPTPLRDIEGDRIEAAGFFEGSDEPVRITETTGRDGKPVYNVSVNKAYANQSAYAIGALIQYELGRHLQSRDGDFTAEEKARSLLMVGEYFGYMYCSYEEAAAITRAIGRHAGVPGLTYDKLYQALESDQSGYVTNGQIRALQRLATIE